MDEGVQRGPAGLLHWDHEIHWHCSIAYLVVRGKSNQDGLYEINHSSVSLRWETMIV